MEYLYYDRKDMFWVYWKKGVLVFWYCLKVL